MRIFRAALTGLGAFWADLRPVRMPARHIDWRACGGCGAGLDEPHDPDCARRDPDRPLYFEHSAVDATADGPAEVSAGQHPAPSAGQPTSAEPPTAVDDPAGVPPSPAGSPTSMADLVAVAARSIAAHGREEYFDEDGEARWSCSQLCGLQSVTAEVHARHVAEIVVPVVVMELASAVQPTAGDCCREADARVAGQLAAAGFARRDTGASIAAEFFPQHTKQPTK